MDRRLKPYFAKTVRVIFEEFDLADWANLAFDLSPDLQFKILEEIFNKVFSHFLHFAVSIKIFKHDNFEANVVHLFVAPCVLPLLLGLDPKLFNLVNLFYFPSLVGFTFLLKLSKFNVNRESRSNLTIIKHLKCHLHTFNVLVGNATVSFRLPSFIFVNFDLYITCLAVDPY